ncbi:membrane lipoprotein [Vibrio phage 1.161.O._10N.261.48.C5]|nr:membrane lipoprotein [Vibrio phage 1.161.O._10N.261.48.C5]
MKTLTKYSLILLATLSVSGCFQEDDKSYVEVGNVAEDVTEEVIEKPLFKVQCWMYESSVPTHTFKVHTYRGTLDGMLALPDNIRVPVSRCMITKI